MVEVFKLKPGEKKFLETLERVHKEKPVLYEKKPEERIKHTIEEIKNQIADLPEIQREEEFHHNVEQSQITNVVAQAIQISLEKGVDEGLRFIYKTKNPYLIDLFHDLLVGHFVELLFQNK